LFEFPNNELDLDESIFSSPFYSILEFKKDNLLFSDEGKVLLNKSELLGGYEDEALFP
jgi:hypothetical protein